MSTARPMTAQEAHTKLIRLEDELRHLMARLKQSGFRQAAKDLSYIVDECLDPVRFSIGGQEWIEE